MIFPGEAVVLTLMYSLNLSMLLSALFLTRTVKAIPLCDIVIL